MLDRRHRGHARVEQRIRNAKDTGLANLPSAAFHLNEIWLQLVLAAQDLLAFFAVLACDDDLAKAEPKTVRYRLLHVAGRITISPGDPACTWTATGPGCTNCSPPSDESERYRCQPDYPPIFDNAKFTTRGTRRRLTMPAGRRRFGARRPKDNSRHHARRRDAPQPYRPVP